MTDDEREATLLALIELHQEGHGDAATALLDKTLTDDDDEEEEREVNESILLEAGKTGRFPFKSGKGFYCVDAGKRVKCPDDGKGAAPAKDKPAPKPAGKPTVDSVHAHIERVRKGEVDRQGLHEIVGKLTVPDIKALQQRLGMGGVKGLKAEQVKAAVERALAVEGPKDAPAPAPAHRHTQAHDALKRLLPDLDSLDLSDHEAVKAALGKALAGGEAPAPKPKEAPKPAPKPKTEEHGTLGKNHPLAGLDSAGQQRKLGGYVRAIRDGDDMDPAGVIAAGPPPGLDMEKFAKDVHQTIKSGPAGIGAPIERVYASAGKAHGLSKHDFQRAVAAMREDGKLGKSGSSFGLDMIGPDRPDLDPELWYPSGADGGLVQQLRLP